jgi:6,7-dimethyl-8-ribityllumazine synthase
MRRASKAATFSCRSQLHKFLGCLLMAGHGKRNVRLGERGGLSAAGLHFGIVVSEFNSFVTDRLLAGALDAFQAAGASKDQLEIVNVPGAFELPIAAKTLASTGRFDSLVCIGCVLRGETSHYDYVCSETARGIQLAQLDTGVPIGFCVLTCDTREQALARAGEKSGNKGYEVAIGAIEMARLTRKFSTKAAATKTRKPRRARTSKRPR